MRLNARIQGNVQGVGFRYFTFEKARRLMLTGWVRNLSDGGVEVEAEGAEQDLRTFLAELYRGPAGSRVRHIEETWLPATGADYNFRIRVYD